MLPMSKIFGKTKIKDIAISVIISINALIYFYFHFSKYKNFYIDNYFFSFLFQLKILFLFI